MHSMVQRAAGAALLAAAALLPLPAASAVVDFEGDDLTGLYFAGDSFVQAGFRMTAGDDFGTVDTAQGLVAGAPRGNPSQFYFGSNDSFLTLTRDDGLAFSLDGFSAAFVPLVPAASQTTVIVAVGYPTTGSAFGTYFDFDTSTTSRFPFATYADPADFGRFADLTAIEFFACELTATSVCDSPTQNNGQFALDDILLTVSPVPEPSASALLAIGLLGVAAAGRRRAR